MLRQILILSAAIALACAPHISAAQSPPTRPVTLVVPYPPGGPTDAAARTVAERMRTALGQPIIIENVAGANGGIGAARVARATPDGFTLLFGNWNTQVSNAVFYPLTYDVLKDFEPLSLVVTFPHVIVANRAVPAADLAGLVAWLKTKVGGASLGSAGIGSGGHAIGLLFGRMTGAPFQHVPYRGSAPAMQDLIAGQIDMMIDAPVITVPQVRAGTIKAYAVTARGRLASAPDIPTAEEAGLPGLLFANWFSIWAPRATPPAVIARLNAAVVEALGDPAIRQRLTELGFELPPREQQTPEALGALQRADTEKWWPVLKASGQQAPQ